MTEETNWKYNLRVHVIHPQATTEKDGGTDRETEDYPQLDHRKSYLALQ